MKLLGSVLCLIAPVILIAGCTSSGLEPLGDSGGPQSSATVPGEKIPDSGGGLAPAGAPGSTGANVRW